jgi:hypothetical protein
MLELIIRNVSKNIIKSITWWSSDIFFALFGCLKSIKKIEISRLVIVHGNRWRWQGLQKLSILLKEFLIGHMSVNLNQMGKVVAQLGSENVECNESPVIGQDCVICEESVFPLGVSSETLHDEQVMELIPLFGKMNFS